MRRLAIVVPCMLLPSLAAADLPPPAGYVEICNVDNYRAQGLRCEPCSTWHSDERPCQERSELSGMTRCCRTLGASAWTEVWCAGTCPVLPESVTMPPATPSSTEPSQTNDGGGGCAIGRGGAEPWLAVLALAVIAAWRRPRRE